MKKVEYRSPEKLWELTKKDAPETISLVRKLKAKQPRNLDDIVHRLHEEAFEKFSCLDCANCCKTIGPRLTDKDIASLSKHLKMKPADFTSKYVMTDEDNDFVFREHPCPFLMPDNYCMVYENRPKACREYPHTDRKRFYQILQLSHKNCETCPVVFEIFGELRKVTW